MPRLTQKLAPREKQIKFDALARLHNDAEEIYKSIMRGVKNSDPSLTKLASDLVFGKPVNQRRKIDVPWLEGVPMLERPEAIARAVMRGEMSLEDARALNDLTATSVEMGQLRLLQQFVDQVARDPGNVSQIAASILPAMQGLVDKDLQSSGNVHPIRKTDLSFLE